MFYTVALISFLVFCQVSSINLKNSKKLKLFAKIKQQVDGPRIKVHSDDAVTSVKVNETLLDMSNFRNARNLSFYDVVSYPFKQGDKVSISALNIGTYSQNNPGYLIAEIVYTDNNGNEKVIPTDDKWICNGENAVDLGYENKNWVFTDSNGQNPGFSFGKYIWSKNVSDSEVTCSVTLTDLSEPEPEPTPDPTPETTEPNPFDEEC